MDIFAWEPADITGVPRSIIEHKLNVNTSVEPELQKRRVLAPEKSEVVTRDVGEWVKAVSKEAVSSVLLTDRKGKQSPIQYVSRTLNEAERNYAPMEKLALSLVHMTRRLRRYFEAHLVKVITDQPIKQILSKTEASKKLAKYAVELGAYNITFEPRNAVKGQVLADFITETPDGESPKK
ncbi:reverse transcriptase domain-containing protein, partial [Tanacetum coccineum]